MGRMREYLGELGVTSYCIEEHLYDMKYAIQKAIEYAGSSNVDYLKDILEKVETDIAYFHHLEDAVNLDAYILAMSAKVETELQEFEDSELTDEELKHKYHNGRYPWGSNNE